MRLTPIVSWRVASVSTLLSFRAVPCPHLYPMPLHTPSLTHAPTTPSFEKKQTIFKYLKLERSNLKMERFEFENGTVTGAGSAGERRLHEGCRGGPAMRGRLAARM